MLSFRVADVSDVDEARIMLETRVSYLRHFMQSMTNLIPGDSES